MSKEWAKRAALPSHVVTMLDNFPTNLHPMSQFSAAITALNSESSFARAYSEGVHKSKYWEVSTASTTCSRSEMVGERRPNAQDIDVPKYRYKVLVIGWQRPSPCPLPSQFVYEDSMDLIAKLPCIAAKIYRNLYREGSSIGAIDSNLDWSHNFTNMLGYSEPQFTELMRLYLTIHRCRTSV